MQAAFLSYADQQQAVVDSGRSSAGFGDGFQNQLMVRYSHAAQDLAGDQEDVDGDKAGLCTEQSLLTTRDSANSEGNTSSGHESVYRDECGDVSADSGSLYHLEQDSSPDRTEKVLNNKLQLPSDAAFEALSTSENNRKNNELTAESAATVDFVRSIHNHNQHRSDQVFTSVKAEPSIKSSYSPSSSPDLEAERAESLGEKSSKSEDLNALQRLQNALEKNGTFNMYGEESIAAGSTEIYQCHLCPYTGSSKFNFSQHMHTHYEFQCSQCDFKSQSNPSLKEHMKIEHNIEMKDFMDEPGVRVPRVNASGKIRMHKCKFCEYKTPTQLEHWDHLKTHIPPEKRFWCHVCPFITDVKHHLTYHLRNHFNSKPFKCNKCEYSCVNKSMLSSHMKSHTNFYQYRCADCSFAAKYANALKNHLRKEKHRPGVVLNPDGSPNPFVIIDVYGTRRGPKIKKDDNGMPILPNSIQENYMSFVQSQCQLMSNAPNDTPSFITPYSQADNNAESPETKTSLSRDYIKCEMCPFSTPDRELLTRHMMNHLTPESQGEMERSPQHRTSNDDLYGRGDSSERMELLRSALAQPTRVAAWPPQSTHSQSPVPSYHAQTINVNPLRNIQSGDTAGADPAPALPQYDPSTAQRLQEYFSRALQTPLLYNLSMAASLNGNRTVPQSTSLPLPFSLCRNQLAVTTVASQMSPNSTNGNERSASPEVHHDTASRTATPSLYDRLSAASRATDLSLPSQFGTPQQQQQRATSNILDHKLEHQQANVHLSEMLKCAPARHRDEDESDAALDLSCLGKRLLSEDAGDDPSANSTHPPTKNRRKGRAQRLEVIAQRLQAGTVWSGSGSESPPRAGSCSPGSEPEMNSGGGADDDWRSEAHTCQSCGIAFKDLVMYTMHMGFHDFRRPFSCNKCGEECRDAIAFFLHIARVPHTS